MKVVILAGGRGTRLSEETDVRPKPMVEIGGRPILWHIMKIYSHYGLNDFVVCCGYKANDIKDYFTNYFLRNSDVTFDFTGDTNEITIHRKAHEQWRVTLVDTGLDTLTAGRVQRIQQYVGNEDFCLTYGDGVSNVDIGALVAFHQTHGKTATVTAVQPAGRFGSLALNETSVERFVEKPVGDGGWINGGFMVLKPDVFKYIPQGADNIMWEADPMVSLASSGNLQAFKHHGFWQAMDTLRDKLHLQELCENGKAPWMQWEHPKLKAIA